MITLVKPLHPQNAQSPIEVTELPIVTLVIAVQPLNEFSPIEVTVYVLSLYDIEFGMLMAPFSVGYRGELPFT